MFGSADAPKGAIYSVGSMYQNAHEKACSLVFVGYQKVHDDAGVAVGFSLYQDSSKRIINGLVVSIYENANVSADNYGLSVYRNVFGNVGVMVVNTKITR